MSDFTAFPPELFTFLRDLRANNQRDWFKEHKEVYESMVRGPALEFVRAMAPHLAEHTPHLVADDRKSGGSMMRIHRDVRFSKDKSPYKINVGIHFRHAAGKSVHAPGLYLHLEPDDVFVGAGMYTPPSPELKLIRAAVATQGSRFTRILEELPVGMEPHELRLKRVPRGYDKEHPMAEELKRKSFIAVRARSEDDATTPGFLDRVVEDLQSAKPLMGFLCEAVGQTW